jgi:transcriptional regulator with XRE-family HTH domain
MPKKPEQPTGFAGQLKRLREAAGLTQQQLAERAGFHGFTIAKLEQGVQEPTWPTVLALAHALSVAVGAFVNGQAGYAVPRPRGRPRKSPAADGRAGAKPSGQKPAPKQGKGGRSP